METNFEKAVRLVRKYKSEYKKLGGSILDCRTDDWVWALPTKQNKGQQYAVWIKDAPEVIYIGSRYQKINDIHYSYGYFIRDLETKVLGPDNIKNYLERMLKEDYPAPAYLREEATQLHQDINLWTLSKGIYVSTDIAHILKRISDPAQQRKILKLWLALRESLGSYYEDLIMDILCFPGAADSAQTSSICFNFIKKHQGSLPSEWAFKQTLMALPQINCNSLKFLKWYDQMPTFFSLDLYSDYLQLRERIKNIYDIRKLPVFPEPNELIREKLTKLHDFCMKLYNDHAEEIQSIDLKEKEKQYSENILPKVKCFEMEGNEFSIIAAPNLASLLEEGRALHHCVGSYVNSVKDGSEYILYMRKNSEIDKPYLTVDITPDKNCRQIHGVNNSNVKSDSPEAQFIQEWAKKLGIDVTKINGICYHLQKTETYG